MKNIFGKVMPTYQHELKIRIVGEGVPTYKEVLTLIGRFTATSAPPAERRI
jgi:hypothetical protein